MIQFIFSFASLSVPAGEADAADAPAAPDRRADRGAGRGRQGEPGAGRRRRWGGEASAARAA